VLVSFLNAKSRRSRVYENALDEFFRCGGYCVGVDVVDGFMATIFCVQIKKKF
jgi:hypothetical protein